MEAVIGEAALRSRRSRAEGPLAMRAQLTHLAETAERPGPVIIRLLPFTAGPSAPGGAGGFTLLHFGPDPSIGLVHLAGPSGGLFPADPQAAMNYRNAFDHLKTHAFKPDQSARRLRELLRAL